MPDIKLIPLKSKVEEIASLYRGLEKKISEIIFSFDPLKYSEVKAMQVNLKINKLIMGFNKTLVDWTTENITKAYNISRLSNIKTLEKYHFKINEQIPENEHKKTIDKYIELTLRDFLKANSSIIQNVNLYMNAMKQLSKERQQLQEFKDTETLVDEIMKGKRLLGIALPGGVGKTIVAGGKTRKQISDLLLKRLKKIFGENGLVIVKGRRFQADYYAKLVARTEMRSAQTDATINTNIQYGNDLIQISEHEMQDCDICKEYQGKIFSISGGHPLYPVADQLPPYHPNCEHVALPYIDTGAKFRSAS